MTPIFRCFLTGIFFLALLNGLARVPVRAQDKEEQEKIRHKKALDERDAKAQEEYRQNFKPPTKTHEFWAAMKFEIAVGKFELAAFHLKLLLEQKKPAEEVDRELVELEEFEGFFPFLRLQEIKKWSEHTPFDEEAKANVPILIKRVTAAVETYLSAPERIKKYITRLDAPTPEERAFAFVQLQKSRQRAVPYLVEALRTQVGKPLRQKVVQAYLRFDSDFMMPLVEVLKAADVKDALDVDLRTTLLEIFRKRGDSRCLPYLWHMANAPQYPELVRDAARDTLVFFLETDGVKLPPAKIVLTRMAEKYYRHKVKFEVGGQRFWKWDGISLALRPDVKTPREAEEFFGLRYAREALDLDPAYRPAQIVLLNFLLERTYDQALDKFFLKPMAPDMQQMLSSLDTELIVTVLERALDEHNLSLVLPTVEILGQRGELRAARPNRGAQPQALMRALFYPDRRVQFAAMTALLRMPSSPVPVASQRIVDLLRRFLASDGMPKALITFCPKEDAAAARATLKELGFDADVTWTLKEAFDKLKQSADYDLVIFHAAMPEKELPYALTQLRGDVDQGRLPLLILAKKDRLEPFTKVARRYENTWAIADTFFVMPEELKNIIEDRIKEASGAKLAADERKKFTRESMDYLWKMGRGEIAGYDVRPAQDALEKALRTEDLALPALETVARFPGRETQLRLASVALDPRYAKLKLAALIELNRHIHKNGLQLDRNQIKSLQEAYRDPGMNPDIRNQLALVLGTLQISAQQSGTRLFQFIPQPPALPEKKDEK